MRTNFSGSARRLIHGFKFQRQQAAALPIALAMTDVISDVPMDCIVVPVPTASSRARQRGYDHGRLLAKQLAHVTGRLYVPCLKRRGQARQVGASRATRRTQLDSAFWVAGNTLRGRSVLLVDDVATTGSSLVSAAKVLTAAGAGPIYAAVFAQKQ